MVPQPNPDELQQRRAQILEELMRRYKWLFWREARRFAGSGQDADDAIEDACIAFLRYFRPDPDDHLPVRWMLTTVKHAALSISKRNSFRRRSDFTHATPDQHDDWWESSVPDPGASVEEQVEDREWVRTCGELLDELKPDERTALTLIAFGFSYREITERQGWTHTKLNRCAAEGRARLRELLALRGEKP